jgi:hypothetical protein
LCRKNTTLETKVIIFAAAKAANRHQLGASSFTESPFSSFFFQFHLANKGKVLLKATKMLF